MPDAGARRPFRVITWRSYKLTAADLCRQLNIPIDPASEPEVSLTSDGLEITVKSDDSPPW